MRACAAAWFCGPSSLAWTTRLYHQRNHLTNVVLLVLRLLAGHVSTNHQTRDCCWSINGQFKLMGRSSGFIAAVATLASGDVDLCLV
ncbi:unnamed protein product, partial [Ectocarpus sp. 12 AP-2014]